MLLLGRTQMVDTCSYEDSIRRLMKCGFDGIEAGVFDRGFHVRDEFFSDGFGRRMRDIMASCGVKAIRSARMWTLRNAKKSSVLFMMPLPSPGKWRLRFLLLMGL